MKMDLSSLYQQLEDGLITCPIDEKEFMPRDILEKMITKENIKAALDIKDGVCIKARLKKPSELPDKVANRARKMFAALVLMNKVTAVQGVLDEGFADEDLPLKRHPDYPKNNTLLSHDNSKTFKLTGWSAQSVNEFIKHKQWRFLAPVIDTTGQLVKVDQECALPFTLCEHMGNGAAGVVYEASLHPAHQRGFKTETIDLQVAVKQFHQRSEFLQENKTLQEIKDLQHPHIIRHLASIDKGEKGKGYIVFPWAAGGNLQDFWEASEQEPTQKLVLWSLQQILGLTSALHELHEHFQCRHGDLKPGNILCVHEGAEIVLKLADFGISRIHHAQTTFRKTATTTAFLTPSYQAPEVEFEKLNKMDQRPRSRKYDVWSLGCVFLEFTIWLLHGPKGVKDFLGARGNGMSSTSSSIPLYSVTDKAKKAAIIHELATWTIGMLESNPLCEGDTALASLLGLIKNDMLEPRVERRPTAASICTKLKEILQEAEKRPSYLLNSPTGVPIPPLNFEDFHSDSN